MYFLLDEVSEAIGKQIIILLPKLISHKRPTRTKARCHCCDGRVALASAGVRRVIVAGRQPANARLELGMPEPAR